MGVPDDANPLNRRLPAEVVSRRHRPDKKRQEEEEPLIIDRAQVLAMKPEQRVKWLGKALLKGQEGKVPMTTIYDIIAHVKFGLGATENVGRKMYKIVRANLPHFSQKQQRFLEGESKLAKDYRYRGSAAPADAEEPEAGTAASSVPAGSEAEADGSGLSLSEIPALWARLSKLTPSLCEEAVGTLDPITKSRLEDFLEARMAAKLAANAAPSAPAAARSRSHSRSKSCSRSRSSEGNAKKADKAKKPDADRSRRARSSSKSSSRHSSNSSSCRRRRRSRSRSRHGSSRGKARREKK